MKVDYCEDMIHKNGNILDQTVGLPLKRKPLYKELILNNNSVIVNNNVVSDKHSSDSNDDLNNNDFDRDESKYYKCPVCKSEDFTTADLLDEHVKVHHPNFKPSCKHCGEVFPSLKLLATHSVMHVTENSAIRHNPINLKILSFLDTKKSYYHHPNEHVETSQSYRCNFCGEHFTGAQFMTHWQQCKRFTADESNSKFSKDDSETEEVKSSFLAGLNLHGRSDGHTSSDTDSNRSLKSDKMEDELTKSAPSSQLMSVIQNTTAYPKHPIFFVPEEDKNFQDDDDDPFKLEVRDMKRRGEFPCRICQKIFRNLRALKGHARIHITCNKGARPYECNICTYTTNDKSMVIRHIRNHNGDHPYKCQLCCSTFTTKANCERHLRNAHRKTSREDIKKLLVDLNNKPPNPVTNFKNKLQSLLTTGLVKNEDGDDVRPPKFSPVEFYKRNVGGDQLDENDKSLASEAPSEPATDHRSDADDSSNSNDSNNNSNAVLPKKVDNYQQLMPVLKPKYSDFHIAGLLDMRTASRPEKKFYESNYKSYNDVMIGTGLIPTIIRDNGFIKVSSYTNHYPQPESDVDEPLDLSVDVLDLSKKKNKSAEDESRAEDLSVRVRDHDRAASPSCKPSLPTQPMFFGKTEAPYNFPGNSIMPGLSPFFVPNPSINAFPSAKMIDSDDDMHGAKMRPLMFGPLVANVDHYEDVRPNVPSFVDQPKDIDNKMEAKFKEVVAKPRPKSSSVKMVMKDGVLVEKQKQRRYRTEKPFSCAYCSGRFTLRSNMDRHVKQQHPGFWRQRQRGGSTRSPRTKSKDESHDTISVKSESHLSQSESIQDFDMVAAEKRSHDSSDIEVDDESEYNKLSKKSRRDLLGDNMEEDDEDDEELVIDEEVKDLETVEEKSDALSTTSCEKVATREENPDLASVRSLLDNVSTQTFSQYFRNDEDPNMKHDDCSEEDEEGLVAGSSSEGNGSGGEENRYYF